MPDAEERPAKVARLLSEFLNGKHAKTPAAVRLAVLDRALGLALDRDVLPDVPAPLVTWVEKIALTASEATDADVRALIAGGYTEDDVLEITEAAAVGASLARLDRGLAAIREARS